MQPASANQSDYEATIRQGIGLSPGGARQSARIGIQGKLFLGFLVLLAFAMVGSYWLFISENRKVLSSVVGEYAVELSQAIAMASEPMLAEGDVASLERIGRDLIRNRDIVTISFFDDAGERLVFVCQDPDLTETQLTRPRVAENLQYLMQVRHRTSATLGQFAEVTVPVLHLSIPQPTELASNTPVMDVSGTVQPTPASRLVGYVSVGVSTGIANQLINRISLLLILLGGVIFLISMPMVYVLVNRILLPIRQLVVATIRIAAGDLETQVEVHRPDLIGTLARAFNDMVRRVKQQQRELAEANKQLAEANRDLESKVQQRTQQLENIAQQLQIANKRLSSEIAEKEDFLRAVSHDLNAPLRNISGMAAMLMMKYRDKFDEDVIHRLSRIQKNVEIETELISELLELSRIKTRRQKMENVDIEALLRELGDMFENDLKTRGIELVIDTPMPVLNCERMRIRQVFQNLIDNAIKYMGDKPEKRIHIGCVVRPSEAEFYVRDTGAGIEYEDQARIFHVFRRGKNQAAQSVSGRGVGLASVKSIIETYLGTIWVESTPGEGSTFRFTINGQHVPQAITMATTDPISNAVCDYAP